MSRFEFSRLLYVKELEIPASFYHCYLTEHLVI